MNVNGTVTIPLVTYEALQAEITRLTAELAEVSASELRLADEVERLEKELIKKAVCITRLLNYYTSTSTAVRMTRK